MRRPLRKRHVFYLSGFDPRGARHYHHLYKTHAPLQSAVNGIALDVGPRRKADAVAQTWRVTAGDTETNVEFLAWDDIVRRHWANSLGAVLRDLWCFLCVYIGEGRMFRMMAACPKIVLAGTYPLAYMLLCGLAGLGAVFAVGALGDHPFFIFAGAACGAGIFWSLYRLGHRFAAFWLLRIYIFSYKWGQGSVPGLEERLDRFARRIQAAARDGEADEIMIVGHSVGTMLAVPVLARVLEDLPGKAPRIVLVTLGQCIPLISLQPEREDYRRMLARVAADSRVLWVDYTAPSDGAAFPKTNPVTASGIALAPGQGPKILSPRFFKLYSKRNYGRLKFDWYTMHFLYLMSTDYPGEYDYFAMTAGPHSFAARFAPAAVEA